MKKQKNYIKNNENPKSCFLSQLKAETMNIFLDNYNFNDISVINKILSKYYFFKYLTLAPYDPMRDNKKSRNNNSREPITEGERIKMEKEKKDKEAKNLRIINKITLGIGKHLTLSENLLALALINLDISQKIAENISKGIIGNKCLHALSTKK